MRQALFYRFSLLSYFLFLLASCSISPQTIDSDAIESQATLPSGFEDKRVARISQPIALAFTPDARMLITEQAGRLRVFKNSLISTPALNLTSKICSDGERGLLGVAVDPKFASNRYIYLFYTFKKSGNCNTNTSNVPVNRVSRFILPSTNVIDPKSEKVLINNIPSYGGNHNGGDLNFGKDGLLYISVGDGGCDYAGNSGCAEDNNAARDRNALVGKILRITPSGDIPTSNPFRGTNTARCNITGKTQTGKTCQEIFATGLRNPFRIAFDSNASGTKFYINDVGQDTWEEIDLGKSGADYGWNIREGDCATGSTTNCGTPPTGLTNPLYDYRNGGSSGPAIFQNCSSISGGAFVPNSAWPNNYNSSYLFADFVCGKIFKLTRNGTTYSASVFASNVGSIIHMTFGPFAGEKALYYTNFNNGGEVRRISYKGN
jgi:glucose/arabinose dehydrogenase